MKALSWLGLVTLCCGAAPGLSGAEDFPAPFNHGSDANALPLPAESAAAGFKLPPGFRANVFAAEPDVNNPVAMTWDGRGRLWVAECYTYADRPTNFDLGLRDRVLIFMDRDGDGRADERKVFCDNVQKLMSVEVGLGGVWLLCLPNLLFIPDRDGNDVPDGPAEVVLDGFGLSPENYHNCANGLKWGLDGWLYGRCGASSPGWIGPPGSTQAERIPIFGGLWRYHPTRRVFETLCHGTTNPWGHDWDAQGELFVTNTVTGHLFHMIPGAHYTRSATLTVNPYVYEPIDTHADHLHWDVGSGTNYRQVAHDQLGGGHAHCGAMIYLADQWPAEFRGKLLTLNLHGRRMNMDRLERGGSGYVAPHESDLAFAADAWFRGIDLNYGPDGSVFVIDWSDTGECHEHDGIHRQSGRVFRVAYGNPRPQAIHDVTVLPELELVRLHRHANEWQVRQARRELANRRAAGAGLRRSAAELRRILESDTDAVVRLRALWTLYTLDEISKSDLVRLLGHSDEHLRVWAIRLLTDFWPIDTVHGLVRATRESIDQDIAAQITALAASDPSGLVRLVIASSLQRLPLAMRPSIAAALMARDEDARDHNLPKLVFYGLAPLVSAAPEQLAPLAARGAFPVTREWIARALAENPSQNAAALAEVLRLSATQSESSRADVLRGLTAGLSGRHKVAPPAGWSEFAEELETAAPDVRELVRNLSVLFGDGRALDEVRAIALDSGVKVPARRAALEALIEARPDDLQEICQRLLNVRFLNMTAVKGLTQFDDAEIGHNLARNYNRFHPSERPAVIAALVSRPSFARGLLDQIEAGKIPASEITALEARQIRNFGDEALAARLGEVWGELRDSPGDKQELIGRLKQQLTTERLAAADQPRGRLVFSKTCANCHRLYGSGGSIGPDLTGSGRHNLEYLLSNIVDPSAVVNKDYKMSVVRLADGRVQSGILLSQDQERVVLQTPQEKLAILREEIDEISPTTLSAMPEGLLQPLGEHQIRDLIAYLMSAGQVELPESAAGSEAAIPVPGR